MADLNRQVSRADVDAQLEACAGDDHANLTRLAEPIRSHVSAVHPEQNGGRTTNRLGFGCEKRFLPQVVGQLLGEGSGIGEDNVVRLPTMARRSRFNSRR